MLAHGANMTTGQTIATAAQLWLKRGSPWMARAKREATAFSPQMLDLGLRELFEDIAANVEELERREAQGGPAVPDGHQGGPRVPRGDSSLIGRAGRTAHLAAARDARPTLCHVLSGNLPNPGIVSIIVGLLSGARNVVKPATGDPMPELFIQSLVAVNPELAKRVALTSNREAYRRADIVAAYGDDETIASLQKHRRQDAGATFFGFGHRVSIGLLDFSQSTIQNPKSKIVSAAAWDASMWDQQGCMSPQCFYVRGNATAFAAALAREMETFDRRWPRATLPFEGATAIARARSEWSFRGRVWASKGSTRWTVVLDERSSWAPSPLNRFVFVRPIEMLMSKLVRQLPVSTVGFAGVVLKEVVALARADRYCSLGEMQRPSLLLTNGSRPRVGDLAYES